MITSLIAIQSIACIGVSLISSTNIIIAHIDRKKVKKEGMKGRVC